MIGITTSVDDLQYYSDTVTYPIISMSSPTNTYSTVFAQRCEEFILRRSIPMGGFIQEPIAIKPNKAWRWYDIFRIPTTVISRVFKDVILKPLLKPMNRLSVTQKHKQKRRRFIQQLREGLQL